MSTKHKRQEERRLEKQKRLEIQHIEKKKSKKKENIKKYSFYAFIGLVGLGFIYLMADSYEPVDTSNLISDHWHATPTVSICGEARALPESVGGEHLGANSLHTHEDGLIHMEGSFDPDNMPTLGDFFRNIGVNFSETQIFDKANGDFCEGSSVPGKVSLTVNGEPSDLLENEPIANKAVYEISFS